MKSNRFGIAVIVALFAAILVGAWYLVAAPSYVPGITATSPSPIESSSTVMNISTSSAASSATVPGSVTVSSPAPDATVGHTFAVAGAAPNNWYFEAVLPIQVDDMNGNLIGSAQGQAQSGWTAEGPVPFTATMTITNKYSGPAHLFVKRDNPSGLTQNDAEIIVPIVISK